jgi:dTMP kinase
MMQKAVSKKETAFFMEGETMKGKLIVLEGIDGSGKETQSNLLEKKLKEKGREVMHISFPDYESPSSALVKMYLKGDFGKNPEDVNPYAASLFYAVDRFASYRMKWKDFYEKGGIVIADRYTTSNMVHQMTKYEDEVKRKDFLSWLEKTEYGELELPRPDLVILLDIPLAVSENLVKERAKKGGSMDIHEQHLDYLRKCHDAYRQLVALYHWKRIPCTEEGRLRSIEDIGKDVEKAVAAVME